MVDLLPGCVYADDQSECCDAMTTLSTISNGLPNVVKPMFARLARRPFNSTDYLYELKWDGIRALAFIDGKNLNLLNRNSSDITYLFPEMSSMPRQVRGDRVVLDGELVCLDNIGHPSYPLLRERLRKAGVRRPRGNLAHYIAFDVLYTGGHSVMREPLSTRKNLLNDLLEPSKIAQVCHYVETEGEAFFKATCEHGLEGMVAKEMSSLYFPGKRSYYWRKVKRIRESEFVIVGYTIGGARSKPFTSLVLGLHDNDGQLVYVGQVSDGLLQSEAKVLASALQKMHSSESPFESLPGIPRLIFWCRPELVCQVEYGEFSEDGKLVYPVFKALRDDKTPSECIIADVLGWPRLLADLA